MSRISTQPNGTASRARLLLGMVMLLAAAILWLGGADTARAEGEGVDVTSPGPKWLDFFCIGNEQCVVGDFNRDTKDDIAVFYRDTRGGLEQGDVMVALSQGNMFGAPAKWAESFCTGAQICKVGDVNADGYDDLIAFNPATTGQVQVAINNNGLGFYAATTWHSYFCLGQEVCDVGDFNGDNRDDIVLFKRSAYTGNDIGDVVVALSNGVNAFVAPVTPLWNPFFCVGGETCGVGDFDGDNRDDIISFAKSATGVTQGAVYVSLSNGSSFVNSPSGNTWQKFFCVGAETCGVGDFTGDNRDDIVTFLGGGYGDSSEGDVYVATSKGNYFSDGWLWNGNFCLAGEVCLTGDFNGDNRHDVVRFLRDTQMDDRRGDVYVAVAAGADPVFLTTPPSGKWHDAFCGINEVCATGDVNGDGLDDAITFVRNAQTGLAAGDVLVALSNGASFGTPQKWHDTFCGADEVCKVGDVNGDGRADIVTFVRSVGHVWVALSNGSSFGTASIWNYFFCVGQEVCEVADVNRDGNADIITFLRGSNASDTKTGDVYVSLSNGSSFGGSTKWNDFFCVGDEQCKLGDANGDGYIDAIAFSRGSSADVYVGLSNGSSFANGVKWHDFFCAGTEVCAVGDFNGDSRADAITFLRNGYDATSAGDVYVALSSGRAFVAGPKWHDFFCIGDEVCGSGDFNGDGADDIITFTRGTAMDVYVALSNRSIPYFTYMRGPLQNPVWLPFVRSAYW